MKQKRRILFCLQSFQHGGIQKSLEHLLSLLDYNRYDVDIFCALQRGYYKELFAGYNLLPQDCLMWYLCVNYRELRGGKRYMAIFVKFISRLLNYIGVNLFERSLRRIARQISSCDYDIVVAYAEGYITRMVSYVECKRKVAWIHIDYKRLLHYEKDGVGINRRLYAKYDAVISPSQFSKCSFEAVYPEFKDKIVAIPNTVNSQIIKSALPPKIDLDARFNTEAFTIVSIGRVCYEKRFFEIPAIVARLKGLTNAPFRWYIIGDGSDVEVDYVRDKIKEHNVEDSVLLLGGKDNPYPYIAASNLLVVTSFSETFSYVIAEAKVLGVPIVSTDFGTSTEVIDDSSGIILPLESIEQGVLKMMSDREYYASLRRALSSYEYNNRAALEAINNILC